MAVTALAGGVGGARLLSGMVRVVGRDEITVIGNTGDDMVLHGLHISPDIDTVVYTLAGRSNTETGWGLAGETWRVMEALEELGGEAWFRLGDRDLATHLFRTQRLSEGASLSQVTGELVEHWGLPVRLLPMSDQPVRTRVTLAGGQPIDDPVVDVFEPGPGSVGSGRTPGSPGTGGNGRQPGGPEVSFQHYFVRLRHSVPVHSVRFTGADRATPAPGVLAAIAGAERIIVCPSNPIVSIGPILSVPGILQALQARRHQVVAVSPIIAGAALKGPADRLLTELGHASSVGGVAELYSPWAGTLVIDEADAGRTAEVEAAGMRAVVAPTVMTGPDEAARLSRGLLETVL